MAVNRIMSGTVNVSAQAVTPDYLERAQDRSRKTCEARTRAASALRSLAGLFGPGVGESVRQPFEQFDDLVDETINLYEQAIGHRDELVVNAEARTRMARSDVSTARSLLIEAVEENQRRRLKSHKDAPDWEIQAVELCDWGTLWPTANSNHRHDFGSGGVCRGVDCRAMEPEEGEVPF
jgi:hypothetical protein